MPCVVRWAEPEEVHAVVEMPILPADGRIVDITELSPEEAESLGFHRHRSWISRLFGSCR